MDNENNNNDKDSNEYGNDDENFTIASQSSSFRKNPTSGTTSFTPSTSSSSSLSSSSRNVFSVPLDRPDFESNTKESHRISHNNDNDNNYQKDFTSNLPENFAKTLPPVENIENRIFDINISEILEVEKTKKYKRKFPSKFNSPAFWEFDAELYGNNDNNMNVNNNNKNYNNNNNDNNNKNINKMSNVFSSSLSSTSISSLSTSTLNRVSCCELLFLSAYFHLPPLRESILEYVTYEEKEKENEMEYNYNSNFNSNFDLVDYNNDNKKKKRKTKKNNTKKFINDTKYFWNGKGYSELWYILGKIEKEMITEQLEKIKKQEKEDKKMKIASDKIILKEIIFDSNLFLNEIQKFILAPNTYFLAKNESSNNDINNDINISHDDNNNNNNNNINNNGKNTLTDFSYLPNLANTIIDGRSVLGKNVFSIEFAIQDGIRIISEFKARKEQINLLTLYRTKSSFTKTFEYDTENTKKKIVNDFDFKIENNENIIDENRDTIESLNNESYLNDEKEMEMEKEREEEREKEERRIDEHIRNEKEKKDFSDQLSRLELRASILSVQRAERTTNLWEKYGQKIRKTKIDQELNDFENDRNRNIENNKNGENGEIDFIGIEDTEMLFYLQSDEDMEIESEINDNNNDNIDNDDDDNIDDDDDDNERKIEVDINENNNLLSKILRNNNNENNENNKIVKNHKNGKTSKLPFSFDDLIDSDNVLKDGEYHDDLEQSADIETKAKISSGRFRYDII